MYGRKYLPEDSGVTYLVIEQRKKIVKRINSSVAFFFIRNSGGYIKHTDISPEEKNVCFDGTHLSELGYDIMLNTLSSALYKIIFTGELVYTCTK